MRMPQTPIQHKHYHGPLFDSYEEGSRTWRDEPKIAMKIHRNHQVNKLYMNDKWNENWQRHLDGPTNKWPFNIERCPTDYMPYDLKFIKSKDLGF